METSAEVLSEFPSLMMEDTTKASPYRAAQFHLRQALQALSDLAPGRDSEKRKAQDDAMIWLRQVLQFLHVHFSPEREATGAASFGELLRQHRSAAADPAPACELREPVHQPDPEAGTGRHAADSQLTPRAVFGRGAAAGATGSDLGAVRA